MAQQSDIEFVVNASKELEQILRDEFDAKGNGLGGKIKQVEKAGTVPAETIEKLNALNCVRNKLVHETEYSHLYELDTNRRQLGVNQIKRDLDDAYVKRTSPNPAGQAGGLLLGLAALILIAVMVAQCTGG